MVLSTIHSAKGREWSIVRVLSAVEGVLPSRLATSVAQIEEERRLLYVAMSRAKDQLQVYVPRRLFLHTTLAAPASTMSVSNAVAFSRPRYFHSLSTANLRKSRDTNF